MILPRSANGSRSRRALSSFLKTLCQDRSLRLITSNLLFEFLPSPYLLGLALRSGFAEGFREAVDPGY